MIHQILEFMINGDWNQAFNSWIHAKDMKLCIQDELFHAEGDVWSHTCMVFEQLANLDDRVLHSTALYHNVAKPQTRTVIQESNRSRVSHPHHSRLGA
jgi:hypothetical protein